MRIHPFHPDEYLLVAINRVIATEGIGRITMRRVADQLNLSPATLIGRHRNREVMLTRAAAAMVRARSDWNSLRVSLAGPVGFLPDDDDGVLAVRAWVGWLELWRSESFLEPVLQQAREDDLMMLARAVEHTLGRAEQRMLLAAIDGAYVGICDPVHPLRPQTAREMVTRYLAAYGWRWEAPAHGP